MNHPTFAQRKIVGIVGGAASGKDTVAGIFAEKGYTHVSSSDLVREEIASRGLVASRPLQTEIANEMRLAEGTGYWVDLSLSRLGEEHSKVAISGLYSPGEGQYLINNLAGVLVGVDIPQENAAEMRYKRLKSRSSGARDDLDFEAFMAANQRENSGISPHETNLGRLMSMARYLIYNSADLDHLREQTLRTIAEIERE